jgi:hypothetical protein
MKSESFIIFLEGISQSDYVEMEDNFEQQLLDDISDSSEIHTMIYNKVPNIFTGADTWIKHTNLRCWYCDFTFDTTPIFIPIYMRESHDDTIEMGTTGNFCSFNCACAYLIQHNMTDFYTYLVHLYKVLNNKKISQIIPSPPKTNMVKYGGWLSDMEYINIISSLESIQNNTTDIYTEHLVSRELFT